MKSNNENENENRVECILKNDIFYTDAEGVKRTIKKGRTLNIVQTYNDNIVLRLGNKMFLVSHDDIETINKNL